MRLDAPVYVLTGPLFERMMRPLPAGGEYQRTPSGYWKVIALSDGRAAAFIFSQNAGRRDNYCNSRISIRHVELRSRLFLFPLTDEPMTSLDSKLGCDTPMPADPVPEEIPAERKIRAR